MATYYYEVTADISPAGGAGAIPAEVEAEAKLRLEERLKNSGCDFGIGRIWVEVKEYFGG